MCGRYADAKLKEQSTKHCTTARVVKKKIAIAYRHDLRIVVVTPPAVLLLVTATAVKPGLITMLLLLTAHLGEAEHEVVVHSDAESDNVP